MVHPRTQNFFSGLLLGIGPVTLEEQERDRVLAEQVRRDAVREGESTLMANYYYTDTVDLARQEKAAGRWTVVVGLVVSSIGGGMMFGWWKLLQPFI